MTSLFRRRSTGAFLVVTTVLASLTACSSEKERSYALPEKLCGTPVDRAALEPLLPGGDKIKMAKDADEFVQRCYLDIDGKSAMSTGAEIRIKDATLNFVAESELSVSPKDTHEGNRIVHGRTGAVARVDCPSTGHDEAMWVSMRIVDRKVSEKQTLAFIRSYAKGLQHTKFCTGKQK